jgi:hypothetical protein
MTEALAEKKCVPTNGDWGTVPVAIETMRKPHERFLK